jgi:hypothetical protein
MPTAPEAASTMPVEAVAPKIPAAALLLDLIHELLVMA